MIRTLLLKTWLLCSIMLCLAQLYAQGWMKSYHPGISLIPYTVYPTADHGYIFSGNALNNLAGERVTKTDGVGNILWYSDFDSVTGGGNSNITQDHGIVMIGSGPLDSIGRYTRTIMRSDKNGNQLWLKKLHTFLAKTSSSSGNMDIDTTDNGGFIASFTVYDSTVSKKIIYIKRLDGNGDVLWQKQLYDNDTLSKITHSLRNAKDGGFVLASGFQGNTYKITKIDSNGDFVWDYTSGVDQFLIPTIAQDGNILVLATNYLSGGNIIIKLDRNSGAQLWSQTHTLPQGIDYWFGNLIEREDKTFALLGTSSAPYSNKFVFSIADSLGQVLHNQYIYTAGLSNGGDVNLYTYHKAFCSTPDKGYIAAGFNYFSAGTIVPFLVKMDSLGSVYPSTVSGYTFGDINGNCSRDTAEILLAPSLITFTGIKDTFTVSTNDSAYFTIGIDTGSYSVNVVPPSPYWQPSACNPADINLQSGSDSVIGFGLQPVVMSPYVIIDGHLSRQRTCMPAIYKAEYCNTGTVAFSGVLEIKVDSLLRVDSASVPWIAQNGNTYFFSVTSLGVMQCTNLEIYCTVSCDVDAMGRTTCIDAHAIVDTVINPSPLWDKSNLALLVVHDIAEDSIIFTIKNGGNGAMINPESLIVIEDNVILFREPVSLPIGGEIIRKVKANGATWRAFIPQTQLNPYSAFATAAIEGAGQNQQGKISTGFLKQFAYNGYYGYHYNTCEQIFNSYDPNQKTVSPTGLGPDHIIDSTTALEYTLDFQNTGNDTAYIVRIMDTLPSYLDPATIRKGVSSHHCQMEIIGKNVISFTFYNINLPDSGANQLRSNGFVKFSIKQKRNNAMGTVIDNQVAIYFDYNPPIVTNTATVRIGELRVTGIESIYADKLLQVNAFPNPFKDKTTIKIEGERFAQLELKVFDISGRQVKQQVAYNTDGFIIDKQGFNSGSYIFEISSNGKPVARGKIMAE